MKRGLVDPERLVFDRDYVVRIESLTRKGAREAMDTVEQLHERIFQNHPFPITRSNLVDEVLGNPTLRTFFDLS